MDKIFEQVLFDAQKKLYLKFYSNKEIPGDKDIYYWIDKSVQFNDIDLPRQYRDKIFIKLKRDATKFKPTSSVLSKKKKRWMHNRSDEQKEDYYSNKYREYLLNEGVISQTDIYDIFKESDEILDLLEDPLSKDDFKRKGLVMGDVQSGKTANYVGLINRAADVKYKLIILIAGLHVNLRRQTQNRVIEGFIGYDSYRMERVGVGEIQPTHDHLRPVSLTGLENDFDKKTRQSIHFNPEASNVPVIMVIKKNVATLKSILDWLKTDKDRDQYKNNYPLLLIDDEADNASVNYNNIDEDPTKTNLLIRKILMQFNKSSYVGYTATPFANIFIDPYAEDDEIGFDLYPDDFIISLEPPPNYIGPKQCFLDDNTSRQYISLINDNEPCIPVTQPKEFSINCLPDSCKKSIEIFLLSIALKIKRGCRQKHTSMLINITHKTLLHREIQDLVSEYKEHLLRVIRYERDKDIESVPSLRRLKHIWEKEYNSEGEFGDILNKINEVSGSIVVKLINSTSKDFLNYSDYEEGLHPIVVGGFSLSRGFTFEGLTVSYLLRNSKMSDTVLQMGRWFGYREGYDDLCRIFLIPISFAYYAHIARISAEIREEIKIAKGHNLTPREYGLKIQNHPGSLLITAKNKMKTATAIRLSLSFSESLYETSALSTISKVIEQNRNLINNFILSLGECSETKKGRLWRNVSSQEIVEFVTNFDVHPHDQNVNFLKGYISEGAKKELQDWDIYLPSDGTSSNYMVADKFAIKKQKRTLKVINDDYVLFDDGGARIVRIWDEEIGLSDEEKKKAEEDRIKNDIKQTAKYFRTYRSKPLLILKVLDVVHEDDTRESIHAYGISFPKSENNRSVEYALSKVALEKWENENY